MVGGAESNDTGNGDFSSLVLGTATRYRNFFRFAGTWKSRSARLLGSPTCALPVPFLFCPVWRPLAAGGSGGTVVR